MTAEWILVLLLHGKPIFLEVYPTVETCTVEMVKRGRGHECWPNDGGAANDPR